MKKKSFLKILTLCGVSGLFSISLFNGIKNNESAVAEEDIPTTTFTSISFKQHDGNNSGVDLRLQFHSTGKGNNTDQESHPTWNDGIRVYDINTGSFISPNIGFGGYTGTDFMLSIKDPADWESGHRYIMEFKEGLVLDNGVKMAKTQYVQFQIYENAEKTAFCFQRMFDDTANNPLWTYKTDTDDVEVMLTNFGDMNGKDISNIAVSDRTVGDSEGYLRVNSSDVDYSSTLGSGHQRCQKASRCNLYDLNFWDKIKFSVDGVNWESAIYSFNYSSDAPTYFNESATWRFPYIKANGSCKTVANKYPWVKFESGAQLPYYEYMNNLDDDNQCLVLTKERIFKNYENWDYREYMDDSKYPTLCDLSSDFAALGSSWSSGNESEKAFFLYSETNNTIEFAFDWKVSTGQTQLITTYSQKHQRTFIWNNGGNAYYAELDGGHGGSNMNVSVSTGDVVRIHYKKVFDADFLGFTSYIWANGWPADKSGSHYTVVSDRIDTTGKGVVWFNPLGNDGAVRSIIPSDYKSQNFKVNIAINGIKQKTLSIPGGTKYSDIVAMKEVQDLYVGSIAVKYLNETNIKINGDLELSRDATINIIVAAKETANFVSINQYSNNKINSDEPNHTRTYLEFDKKPTKTSKHDSIGEGKVTFNGTQSTAIEGFKVWCGDTGGNFVIVDIPLTAYGQNASYPYDVLQLESGIDAYDVILGSVNLYLDPETNKWLPFTSLHTVAMDGTILYIPDGLTIPQKDLSKYCSASFMDEDGNPFDISAPITKDLVIISIYIDHDYVKHDAADSDCKKAGNVEYYTCSHEGCDKIFVKEGDKYIAKSMDDITVAKKDHAPTDGVTFSFSIDGKTCKASFNCSLCHESIEIDATVTSEVTKEATCAGHGETTYTATYLTYSDAKVVADIPSISHKDYSVSEITGREATCTNPGYQSAYYCSDCGLYYKDASLSEQSLIGDEEAYNAWIVSDGQLTKEHTCSVHYDALVSTCSANGHKEYYRCTECNQYFEDADGQHLIGDKTALNAWLSNEGQLALNEHNHDECTLTHHNAVSSTCSTKGNIEYWSCSCGKYLIEQGGKKAEATWEQIELAIDASKHAYTFVEGKPATKDAEGVKDHYECLDCHKLFIKDGDNFIEVTSQQLVIEKISSGGCKGTFASIGFIAVVAAMGASVLAVLKKEI